jgi:GAF domain-containing protein
MADGSASWRPSDSPRHPEAAEPGSRLDPPDAGDPGRLGFPSVARLELDDLLEQLVARARDVQETQGRLRGLLRAYLTIAGAADLEDVLRHIVSAARELVSARYAALGVVRDGRLVRFLHEGMDAETVSRIGALPEGKGLLGRLVDYPEPLRLADIGSSVSSVGFPEHHPPMRSFLGVPIQVGGRVFGNLYLTDKQTADEFSADDQELVQALATAAAFAIDNARLLDQVRRGQDWQNALVEITTGLLSGTDPDHALRELVHHALVSARGVGAGILVPDDAETLALNVVEGVYERWAGRRVRRDDSLAGAALAAGSTILAGDPVTDAPAVLAAESSGVIGPTLAVPILGTRGPSGVLCISRCPGDEPFDDADQALIGAFASRAELALGLAASRRETEEMQMVDDRARIAEQLREQVISRLFAAGLSVQSVLPRVSNPSARQALSAHIDEIDAIIADIRTAVFSMRDPSAD